MPATTTSQATTTLTATAAIIGDVTAIAPSTINKTPHKSDQVEACRTTSDGVCCAIKGLLKGRRESSAEDVKIPERGGGLLSFCRRAKRGYFSEIPATSFARCHSLPRSSSEIHFSR